MISVDSLGSFGRRVYAGGPTGQLAGKTPLPGGSRRDAVPKSIGIRESSHDGSVSAGNHARAIVVAAVLDPGDGGEQAREARFERRPNIDDRDWDRADGERLYVARAVHDEGRAGRLPQSIERADHDRGWESEAEGDVDAQDLRKYEPGRSEQCLF